MIKCEAHKGIDRSSTAAYDRTLKEELEVFIIEQVRVPPCSTTEKKEQLCEGREGHWQTMLRTLTRYGGLNVNDNRVRAQKKLYTSSNKYKAGNSTRPPDS